VNFRTCLVVKHGGLLCGAGVLSVCFDEREEGRLYVLDRRAVLRGLDVSRGRNRRTRGDDGVGLPPA
jgi:hypothetical protein